MPWPLHRSEKRPNTHCIGGWVEASLNNLKEAKEKEKKKYSCPCQTLNLESCTVIHPVV
jgi:hypothetical protein